MRAKGHPLIEEMCEHADPLSDVEHYVVCPVCGQIFDCREQRQMQHHTEALHDPLLLSA